MIRITLAIVASLAFVAMPVAAADPPPTLDLTPVCVDGARQFVWTVDVSQDGTVSGTQPGGQRLRARAVQAGAENMIVFGLVGGGDVTITLDGTTASDTAAGSTTPCGAPPSPVTVVTQPKRPLPFLPETSTE